MPNQPAGGQRTVLIWMSDEILEAIEKAIPRTDCSDRAAFVRLAVYEKLVSMGYDLDKKIAWPRGRVSRAAASTARRTTGTGTRGLASSSATPHEGNASGSEQAQVSRPAPESGSKPQAVEPSAENVAKVLSSLKAEAQKPVILKPAPTSRAKRHT